MPELSKHDTKLLKQEIEAKVASRIRDVYKRRDRQIREIRKKAAELEPTENAARLAFKQAVAAAVETANATLRAEWDQLIATYPHTAVVGSLFGVDGDPVFVHGSRFAFSNLNVESKTADTVAELITEANDEVYELEQARDRALSTLRRGSIKSDAAAKLLAAIDASANLPELES